MPQKQNFFVLNYPYLSELYDTVVGFCIMFVFQKLNDPQIRATLLLSVPEKIKIQGDSHFLSQPR